MIKVDLAKAYDMMNWNFVRLVLIEIDLPTKLIQVIIKFIETVKMTLMWKGQKDDYFNTKKGFSQGDLISLYLLVMYMDKLPHMISDAAHESNWEGMRARRNGSEVAHLIFADDLLLFGKAFVNQIKTIKNVLNKKNSTSGQQISYEDSSIIFSKNTNSIIWKDILPVTGIKKAS